MRPWSRICHRVCRGVAVAALGLACSAVSLAAEVPATVLLVGDSTLAPETGYGDALCRRLAPAVACLNLARGGRSTLSYRSEGLWDRVIARLKAGGAGAAGGPHHVLIQFGHNDQPGKPGRSTDLAREFPANLARYVAEVRAAGGQPLLGTPLTRRSFREGRLVDDLGPWADAVRRVAEAQRVPLVDVHALSASAMQQMGEAQADRLAMAPPAFDRTHVGPQGACLFADLVAPALAAAVPALASALRPVQPCAEPIEEALPPRAALGQPGWAIGTLGGRGGRIVRVTQLGASGPGSLRAAIEASGPRIVVFEVGGVIDLAGGSLRLDQPFITLAGQTAPHPGITIVRGEFDIATHDVIVQHLMFRPGGYGRAPRSGNDHDGLSTQGGAHHVIVDHCSFSWATDENLSVGGPRFSGRRATGNAITFSHNLVYEGLAHSVHAKGEHSKGTLVHDNASGILLLGNVYASNRERNALFKGGVLAAMVNNLVYNPGTRAVHYNLIAHEWEGQALEAGRLALVGNVLRHGPDTRPGTPLFAIGGAGDLALHLHDNLAVDEGGRPVPETGRYGGGARLLGDDPPYLPPRLRTVPAAQLEDRLLLAAGARPWDRDPIDVKLLSDIAEGRGAIVDSEDQSSGLPRYLGTMRPFDESAWNLHDMSPQSGWASLFGGRPR